jgi:hypothetical protein
MDVLKNALIKELRERSHNAPKGADFTFTRDFMVYLFKLLFTYQTIGREVLKEQIFEQRINLLKANELTQYKEVLEKRQEDFTKIQSEIKEIVFDYFNIITKEYELSYDKCRNDQEYQDKIALIKS